MARQSRSSRRSMRGLAVVVLTLAALPLSSARELLPFPSQQQQPMNAPVQQSAPSSQGYYISDFERSIRTMDCAQLQSLKTKLVSSQRTASALADREYFGHLVNLVDQRSSAQRCRPG